MKQKKIEDDIIFDLPEIRKFRQWIDINVEEVSWNGKYQKEFEEFWNFFFLEGLSFKEIIERFKLALFEVKTGPLHSWFLWLRNKLTSYVFIFHDKSLLELSVLADLEISELGLILYHFFVDRFPHFAEVLVRKFNNSNLIGKNLELRYSELKSTLQIPQNEFDRDKDLSIISELKITVLPEWIKFYNNIKKSFYQKRLGLTQLKKKASFRHQFQFIREVVILFSLGLIVLFGLRFFNEKYEEYLVGKLTDLVPSYFKNDETSHFYQRREYGQKERDQLSKRNQQLEEFRKIGEMKIPENSFKEERYETESEEVKLTFLGSLPEDFDTVDLEQSDYEEYRKGGYRDTIYAHRKVYRVLIKSDYAKSVQQKVNELLVPYNVTQAGNVRPGTTVPGGIYYNLFVPRKYLKDFLTKLSHMEQDAAIYESRNNRWGNPPGMNKVFIWIKKG